VLDPFYDERHDDMLEEEATLRSWRMYFLRDHVWTPQEPTLCLEHNRVELERSYGGSEA
jgi:hypothetical protein